MGNSQNASAVLCGMRSVFTSCERAPYGAWGVSWPNKPRNPTLSYTQRLENKIKELERQLSAVKTEVAQLEGSTRLSVSSPGTSSSPARPEQSPEAGEEAGEESLAGSLSGMKIDDNGVITYHGNTSFFQLPNDNASTSQPFMEEPVPVLAGDPDVEKRERLVLNAWQ